MKRQLGLLLGVIALAVMVLTPPVHANSTLFFDNFALTPSGFPDQWSPRFTTTAPNLTQNANYAILAVPKGGATDAFCNLDAYCIQAMLANISQTPILSSNTKDGQYIQMIWRLEAENLTAAATTANRQVEVSFGLRAPWTGPGSGANWITFDLAYVDVVQPTLVLPGGNPHGTTFGQRSLVSVTVDHPMNTASNCMYNATLVFSYPGNCNFGVSNQGSLVYTTPQAPINLAQVHVFTMEGRFFPVSHTSWMAFEVDGNGFANITQAACQCIDGTAGSTYVSMYPMIEIAYQSVNNAATNQGVATLLNYVLVSDYPATAPAGQAPPTSVLGAVLPKGPSQAPFCSLGGWCGSGGGTTVPNYFVALSNSISPGNTFVGGYMLTWIITAAFVIVFAMLKIRNTWAIGTIVIGVSTFMFWIGVISILTVALQLIIVIGGVVGLYKLRMGKEGYEE